MKKSLFLFLFWMVSSTWAQDGHFSLFISHFKTPERPLAREIFIYLPPGYNQNPSVYYPVLYMHDGQNLFDPARAYLGQTWNVENTLNNLILSKKIDPLIVVAIDNSSDRVNEYTHEKDPVRRQGGKADLYLNMLVNDIKPRVDQNFRTLKTRSFTAIAGSSLGGLVSLYAGYKYPQVFGSVAAFSPSIWWNNQSIIGLYKKSLLMPIKLYLDSGTRGGDRPDDVYLLEKSVLQYYANPQNVQVVIQPDADHNEKYWAERFPKAVQFLFPLKK